MTVRVDFIGDPPDLAAGLPYQALGLLCCDPPGLPRLQHTESLQAGEFDHDMCLRLQ